MPKPPRPAHHTPQKRISRHDQLDGALPRTQPLSDSGREQKELLQLPFGSWREMRRAVTTARPMNDRLHIRRCFRDPTPRCALRFTRAFRRTNSAMPRSRIRSTPAGSWRLGKAGRLSPPTTTVPPRAPACSAPGSRRCNDAKAGRFEIVPQAAGHGPAIAQAR